MNIKGNAEQDEYQSELSNVYQLVSESGEHLLVAISPSGFTVIQVEILDENTKLGSLLISGLTPQLAASKSKGFWGKLWDKIKKIAEDVIDTFTLDAGPFTCRPHAKAEFQDGRLSSITVGISCSN